MSRVNQLDARAAMLARVFGPDAPVTHAAIARWRAAAGYQPQVGSSVGALRAWNREAGESGNGNRSDRKRDAVVVASARRAA